MDRDSERFLSRIEAPACTASSPPGVGRISSVCCSICLSDMPGIDGVLDGAGRPDGNALLSVGIGTVPDANEHEYPFRDALADCDKNANPDDHTHPEPDAPRTRVGYGGPRCIAFGPDVDNWSASRPFRLAIAK